MKRRFEPIEVDLTRGWPVAVRRGRKTHRVRHLVDYWVVQGKWWADEERRVYFRVLTTGGTMDIFRTSGARDIFRTSGARDVSPTDTPERWMLSKMQD